VAQKDSIAALSYQLPATGRPWRLGTALIAISGWIHTVIGGRHEACMEDLLVHVGLEQLIDSLGLAGHVVCGDQLGLDRDRELMGRVARKSEALAVICDEFDGNNDGLVGG